MFFFIFRLVFSWFQVCSANKKAFLWVFACICYSAMFCFWVGLGNKLNFSSDSIEFDSNGPAACATIAIALDGNRNFVARCNSRGWNKVQQKPVFRKKINLENINQIFGDFDFSCVCLPLKALLRLQFQRIVKGFRIWLWNVLIRRDFLKM